MKLTRIASLFLITAASGHAMAEAAEPAVSISDLAELIGIISSWLLGSIAVGFVLNRFVLGKLLHGSWRAIGLATARALFYAPSLVDVGHGVYFPYPLLLTLVDSSREFAPELDMPVFLLPIVVFVSSLAFVWSRRFGWWFCALQGVHLTLFLALPFAFASYDMQVAWLAVNDLPWYPFRQVQLPVTLYGWLTLPEAIEWVWCILLWALFYGVLAMAFTRLNLALPPHRAKTRRNP